MSSHVLDLPEVALAYDVRGPVPTADGLPLLVMVGQPMCADGFHALASHLPDRTVVTYDPRGLGRSERRDGRDDQTPTDQAADLHALVEALGAGPVEVFASSGGAVTALEWVTRHPEDVTVLVAHEPPLVEVLPDADVTRRALQAVKDAYQARGHGAGMAAFVAMTMWQGEYTEEYLARPLPDPAAFGMPADDDGSRDDPLLSDRAASVTAYRPDLDALAAAPTRVVVGVGVETGDTFTARTARALAERMGQEPVEFPSHHGGFAAEEGPWPGQATAFAPRLAEVLAERRPVGQSR